MTILFVAIGFVAGMVAGGFVSAGCAMSRNVERDEYVAKLQHDVHAYRGALGYPVPTRHNRKLSDGSTPDNIVATLRMCSGCGLSDIPLSGLSRDRRS